MKLLILDNYDSFTYNLYHMVQGYGVDVEVHRNDEISLDEVERFSHIILSPGPGLPKDAGIMPQLVKRYAAHKKILGVCLGMQCIAEIFGATLHNLDKVKHGIPSLCNVDSDEDLFQGIVNPVQVGHYHSWVVDAESLPPELLPTATNEEGLLMALRHKTLNVSGVQFHPESVLTPTGHLMIANWLGLSIDPLSSSKMLRARINIAIDGHSACGKSTVSKMLSDELGYIYIDSGAMYRAVTLYALENGLAEGKGVDVDGLVGELQEIEISQVRNEQGQMRTNLNGHDVEDMIRTMRVSRLVSKVSAISEVREKLVDAQKKLGVGGGVIMDGRDIGTVVFPDAELKVFLTASIEQRTRRRWTELLARGLEMSLSDVADNLQERDLIDSTRDVSPLTQAEDAILIDNSTMTLEQTLDRIKDLAFSVMA
jgi:cytidylate kinase